MNNLPDDVQYIIYKYKHQLEFNDVLNELTYSVCLQRNLFRKLANTRNILCCMCELCHPFNYDCFRDELFSDCDISSDDDESDGGLEGPRWMYYI